MHLKTDRVIISNHKLSEVNALRKERSGRNKFVTCGDTEAVLVTPFPSSLLPALLFLSSLFLFSLLVLALVCYLLFFQVVFI